MKNGNLEYYKIETKFEKGVICITFTTKKGEFYEIELSSVDFIKLYKDFKRVYENFLEFLEVTK